MLLKKRNARVFRGLAALASCHLFFEQCIEDIVGIKNFVLGQINDIF